MVTTSKEKQMTLEVDSESLNKALQWPHEEKDCLQLCLHWLPYVWNTPFIQWMFVE